MWTPLSKICRSAAATDIEDDREDLEMFVSQVSIKSIDVDDDPANKTVYTMETDIKENAIFKN